ncbi:MAG: hypothetical protein OER83_03465 [Flavobacteriaceae bacterium]|nr:hypothetical protein [Flavobacteriaceae bacterium]MDH3795911.1 hypothetical protein [Flavobacteriaceae bacterium]
MGPQTITLRVEAAKLYSAIITNKNQMPTYCKLVNGEIKPPNGKPLQDFTTDVDLGDKISWQADAIASGELGNDEPILELAENYRVTIDSIAFQLVNGENNFFEGDPIVIFDPGNSGKITNQQMKSSGLVSGEIYTYTIDFSIIIPGYDKKSFFIDPKLQIK